MISLGILSGLKFDPPLGLFMDIGGGSVGTGCREPIEQFRYVQRTDRRGPADGALPEA